MSIETTRDLRSFLAETMVMVRDKKVTANDANAIAKLRAQINQSLAIEVNAAVRQGLENGAYVDANPMRIADGYVASDEEVWCSQCDGRVKAEDTATCKSKFCPFHPAQDIKES